MTAPAPPNWAPPETWAAPPDRPNPVRRLGLVLVALFRRVVAEPVRDGRLRIRGGPPGLGVLVVTGAVCFVAALLLAATGPELRERLSVSVSPVGISAPDRLVWLVVAFVLLAAALVQVAGLHAPWWGRVGALALSGTFLAAAGIQADPGPAALRHAVLAGSCWLALVLLSVLRRRRLFRWWEAVAVLALLGVPTLVTAATTLPEQYAENSGAYVTYAWFLLLNLGALAAPIVLAAGFALAQVSYAIVVWGVALLRVGGRPPTPPQGFPSLALLKSVWGDDPPQGRAPSLALRKSGPGPTRPGRCSSWPSGWWRPGDSGPRSPSGSTPCCCPGPGSPRRR